MAMCVMAVVAVAPCQCFSPGGNQITSPGRTCSIGSPQRWARPQPAVTIRVWPSGWVCHAVRAPGSNVTLAPTLQLLTRRPIQDLVDVHVLRLADGERDRPGERLGRNRDRLIELANALGDVRLGHAVWQLRRHGAR